MSVFKTFLSKRKKFLPLLFMVSILIPILCSSWICDDAFITMRSVKHFLQGYGWRYNIAERVQTYTAPLLLICMTIAAAVTREYYFTLLFLNIVTTAAALYLFYFRQEKSLKQLVFCSLLLFLSASFSDYATSGLENSFSFLLCALFFLTLFSKTAFDGKDLFRLSLLTGLILLNRTDTVLIVFPALAYICLKRYDGSKKRLFFIVSAGLSPFILWEIFSIIYYGFPFPNSFYTKLNADIPLGAYLIRGLRYYEYSLLFDTITLFGIAAGLFVLFYKPADFRFTATGTGIVLYLLYILYIGGDFMGGRFFSVPFFICVFVLPYNRKCSEFNFKTAFFFTVVCLATTVISVTGHSGFSCFIFKNKCLLEKNGTVNEKQFYANSRKYEDASYKGEKPIDFYTKQNKNVQIYIMAGFKAFSEPDIHVMEIYGITDPLLVRLPLIDQKNFRIGHLLRALPKGYKESLLSGKNLIQDPEIAAYYDKIRKVVSGDVFSLDRFRLIWELNTGKPFPKETLFKKTDASEKQEKFPELFSKTIARWRERGLLDNELELSALQKDLKKYDYHIGNGFIVHLEKPSKSKSLSVEIERSLFSCPEMIFVFFNSEKGLYSHDYFTLWPQMTINVPENMQEIGFDQIIAEADRCKNIDLHLLKKFDLSD